VWKIDKHSTRRTLGSSPVVFAAAAVDQAGDAVANLDVLDVAANLQNNTGAVSADDNLLVGRPVAVRVLIVGPVRRCAGTQASAQRPCEEACGQLVRLRIEAESAS
jgi:hypothetical protein